MWLWVWILLLFPSVRTWTIQVILVLFNEFLRYNIFICLSWRSPFDPPLCQIGEKFPYLDAQSHSLIMINLSKIYQVARRLEFQFNNLKRQRRSYTQIRKLIDQNVWLYRIKQFTSCLDPQNWQNNTRLIISEKVTWKS